MEHDSSGRDYRLAGATSRPVAGNFPVGFLSIRLEPGTAGVRATLSWNIDVDRRNHDNHMRTLDLDVALRQVRDFIDEYELALSRL